jgi:hypothetical protein
MASSEERIGEIQSLFRNVNERIAFAAERYDVESAEFFCECHDPACGARVVVPLDEYETVWEKGTRFLHAVGHLESDFEGVVARRPKSAIVEKFGRTLAEIRARPVILNADALPI